MPYFVCGFRCRQLPGHVGRGVARGRRRSLHLGAQGVPDPLLAHGVLLVFLLESHQKQRGGHVPAGVVQAVQAFKRLGHHHADALQHGGTVFGASGFVHAFQRGAGFLPAVAAGGKEGVGVVLEAGGQMTSVRTRAGVVAYSDVPMLPPFDCTTARCKKSCTGRRPSKLC